MELGSARALVFQVVSGVWADARAGTPGMIADQMEEWLFTEASDGFNIMFPYLPGGLNDFVYRVVPELQRRGLFRREYEGAMLRENLGLPRPRNRFFSRSGGLAQTRSSPDPIVAGKRYSRCESPRATRRSSV